MYGKSDFSCLFENRFWTWSTDRKCRSRKKTREKDENKRLIIVVIVAKQDRRVLGRRAENQKATRVFRCVAVAGPRCFGGKFLVAPVKRSPGKRDGYFVRSARACLYTTAKRAAGAGRARGVTVVTARRARRAFPTSRRCHGRTSSEKKINKKKGCTDEAGRRFIVVHYCRDVLRRARTYERTEKYERKENENGEG